MTGSFKNMTFDGESELSVDLTCTNCGHKHTFNFDGKGTLQLDFEKHPCPKCGSADISAKIAGGMIEVR